MGRRRHRERNPLNAEINVVSLIDVMMLLLVIFMITAPMMQGGIEVKLPRGEARALEALIAARIRYVATENGKMTGSDKAPASPVTLAVGLPLEAAEIALEEFGDEIQKAIPKLEKVFSRYNAAKAKALLKDAGYPNGFETQLWSAYNHTTAQKVIQFLQQQLAQVGIKASVQALEAGQRVEKVESAQDAATAPVRLYYVGWSSSTGEADWAMRPLLASESHPPKMFNTAYYKNDVVDQNIAKALNTTDPKEKTRLYTEAQKQIWSDAPWAFLVTEQLLSASSKKLTGFHVMPDASFNFDDVDLK